MMVNKGKKEDEGRERGELYSCEGRERGEEKRERREDQAKVVGLFGPQRQRLGLGLGGVCGLSFDETPDGLDVSVDLFGLLCESTV